MAGNGWCRIAKKIPHFKVVMQFRVVMQWELLDYVANEI